MSIPVDVSEVVSAVATRMSGLSGYVESTFHPAAFPGRDPGVLSDKSFVVWSPTTAPVAGRQNRGATYAYVESELEVRALHRIPPKDQRQGALDAYAAEKAGMDRLLGGGWATNFHLVWLGSARSLVPALVQWELVTLRLKALHYLAVTATP